MLRARFLVALSIAVALLFVDRGAHAQAVKPWFLIVLDTSGSMGPTLSSGVSNSCNFAEDTKMAAAKCAINNMINSTGDAEFGLMQFAQNSCSFFDSATCNETAASAELRVGVSSDPSSLLALVDDDPDPPNRTDEVCGAGYTPLGGSLRAAQAYFEGGSSPTISDPAVGCRPISIILLTDGEERCPSCDSDWSACPDFEAAFPSESCAACDSDGYFESAPEAAYDMFTSTSVPTGGSPSSVDLNIRTYVIGFGISEGDDRIERIALGGGTDNPIDGPGTLRGFYADNEAQLSAALAQIIFDSQLNEQCNGVDDDCDEKIDEGHVTYCDIDGVRSANPSVPHPDTGAATDQALVPGSNLSALGGACTDPVGCSPDPDTPACCPVILGERDNTMCASTDYDEKLTCDTPDGCTESDIASCMVPANVLCENPGELCDGLDNNCNGEVDEEPIVGTRPTEVCNNLDDDCDGSFDEDCEVCAPNELCDGVDNDCDDEVDENLERACGFNLGECESGFELCTDGGNSDPDLRWTIDPTRPCVLPDTEECDGLDNDCDGSIDDGLTRTCQTEDHDGVGECELGVQSCNALATGTPDSYGVCEFEVLPDTELCDGLDNDCDGATDEADGEGDFTLSRSCGTDAGICERGTELCTDGGNSNVNLRYTGCDAVTGGTEMCNRDPGAADQTQYDEDCDGRVDESDPQAGLDCLDDGGSAQIPPTSPPAGVGICTAGQAVCFQGALICPNYRGPETELCDSVDSNCNGDNVDGVGPTVSNPDAAAGSDVRLGTPCGFDPDDYPAFPDALVGIGACGLGTLVCDDSVVGSEDVVCIDFGAPSAEVCNGEDDDCDGRTDENVFPDDASSDCQTGVNAGPFPFDPPREFCGRCVSALGERVLCRESLIDDDPSGSVTCGDLGYGGAGSFGGVDDCCGTYQLTSSWASGNLVGAHDGVNVCALGRFQCLAGAAVCADEITPGAEECDGLDNDCDSLTDEFSPGVGEPCGTDVGVCTRGTLQCTGADGLDCMGQYDGLDNELCNGLDDDCDGFIDEGNPEGGGQCGGGACRIDVDDDGELDDPDDLPCGDCQYGVETCVTLFDDDDQPIGGELGCVGSVEPGDELCDGLDNDCDSRCRIDDSDPDAPVQVCDPSCSLPDSDPDFYDCDAFVDEGVDETDDRLGEECGDDTGECDTGTFACLDGTLDCQGDIEPADEVCNGLDDDCDGIVDDGIPVGAPCGSDIGECQPGVQVCDPETGEPVCQGGVDEIDEVCDGLDNDCDGTVDEDLGLGEACGSDVGECETGAQQCVDGRISCVGESGPSIEICDCADNDCDGNIDEDTGDQPLCPGGTCVMCQCALPCADAQEFSSVCPEGKAAVTEGDECYCVGQECDPLQCRQESIEVGGEVQCAPNHDFLPACGCRNNECTFACSGKVCEEGLVCDPTDGRCRVRSCLLPQFRCENDQKCVRVDEVLTCVDDPCADSDCDEDQACRDGACFDSCATVECDSGQQCRDGDCVDDPCASESCETGEICDPDDGECVVPPANGCLDRGGCREGEVCEPISGACEEDPCLSTRCPFGEECDSETGQCALRCGEGFVWCDGDCINPMTSRTHCGASAPCLRDNVGSACVDGEVCSNGECSDSCADGLLNCGGECIDPMRDQLRCGASDDCEGDNAGEVCRTGTVCMGGECQRIQSDSEGAGSGAEDTRNRVIASGGGGCTCSVPGSDPTLPGSRRGPLSLLLGLFGLSLLARRRLLAWLGRAPGLAYLVSLLLLLGPGCKVDTFCLDCPSQEAAGSGVGQDGGDDDPFFGEDQRDGSVAVLRDGSTSSQSDADTPAADSSTPTTTLPDGAVVECLESELCNGRDDDCDGTADEDVDPEAENIDLQSDPSHCGECGLACTLDHAFSACDDGECVIDREADNGGCDIGFHDLDEEDDNGCEYRCLKTADDDATCDLRDSDCDGTTDEDVDLDNDIENCGACGVQCRFLNAAEGGACIDGECVLDDSKCDEGFRNVDGVAANGCEKSCQVFPPVAETCNRADDDCDGELDEGVAATDDAIGVACRTGSDGSIEYDPPAAVGACVNGTSACVGGSVVCQGEVAPTGESCNGADDDCDSELDESDQLLGGECGTPVGACVVGEYVCNSGELECGGTNLVEPAEVEICNNLDDDCDGRVDEMALSVGSPCTTRNGGLEIDPTSPPEQGNCSYGMVACVSGTLVCQGEMIPQPEQCDNTDWDCDGDPVNGVASTDSRIGETCGNQLGICEPGERECSDEDPGAGVDWQVVCTAGGVEPDPDGETCNGLDDDCDGKFDEFNGSDPPLLTGVPCYLDQIDADPALDYVAGDVDPGASGLCVAGSAICSGGQPACLGYQGPQPELCDGLDNDCDNVIDEAAAFEGLPCNHLTGDPDGPTWPLLGECTQGTWDCPAPSGGTNELVCVGGTRPADAEVCNGIDDDCDGLTDNDWDPGSGPADGDPCCPSGFVCTPGTTNCDQGSYACVGESGVVCISNLTPTFEVCDNEDNDCDGDIDNGFEFDDDPDNCGSCGNDCDDPGTLGYVENAIMVCNSGVCEKSQCEQGFFDAVESPGPQVDDCDYECTVQGDEVCNGEDDDCDGLTDDEDDDWGAPADDEFCSQIGECAGNTAFCNETDDEWQCTITPDETDTCDGLDNDCDGRTDEDVGFQTGHSAPAGTELGGDCLGPGIGACRQAGELACDSDDDSGLTYICVDGSGGELGEADPGSESACDNRDNDCDGAIDERCDCDPDDGGCSETAGDCVWDDWADLPSGGFIFAYEASRPDATSTSQGGTTTQNGSTAPACSTASRMPWTNVSYADALAHCEAVHPDATLCTRDQWFDACECGGTGTSGSAPYFNFGWSYPSCSDPYDGMTCNGVDYDVDDEVIATGVASGCYRSLSGVEVFDLSGNVKELTLREDGSGSICDPDDTDTDCTIMVRGGAMNNTAPGTACGFERSFWPVDAPFHNVGFRCCRP